MQECPNKAAANQKPDISLVAPDFILSVAEVLTSGRGEHGARQWEDGMAWSLAYNSLMRHMLAWAGGEDKDPKSGMSHLAHAACRIMMLVAYENRGLGVDDRVYPKKCGEETIIDWCIENNLHGPMVYSKNATVAPSVYFKLPTDLKVGDKLLRDDGRDFLILRSRKSPIVGACYTIADPHDNEDFILVYANAPLDSSIVGYIRS